MTKRRGSNEGSIYKRKDGLWAGQITLPDGRRLYKYARKQSEVSEWLLDQRQAVRAARWTTDGSMTVSAFLERYLREVVTPTVRQSTLVSYTRILRAHIGGALGAVRLTDLTPEMVQRFYADKLAQGQSPRSVQYMHAVLHKALDQALRWDLVTRNVSDLADPPSVKRHLPVVWSLDQVQRFVEAAKGHRHQALFILALACGLRQGELLGLQIEDVDLAGGYLQIRHVLQELPGQGRQLTTPKTYKSRRRIRIPEPALVVLREHLAAQKRKSGFVFVTGVGTPIGPRDLVKVFKAVLAQAGLPEIRFHDLRHLCATLHLMAGTNPAVVAQILGHSTVVLTLNTYSHILTPVQDEAAERMGKLLGS